MTCLMKQEFCIINGETSYPKNCKYFKGEKMSKKLLGLKPLDFHADIMNMVEPITIDVDDCTEQEKMA